MGRGGGGGCCDFDDSWTYAKKNHTGPPVSVEWPVGFSIRL